MRPEAEAEMGKSRSERPVYHRHGYWQPGCEMGHGIQIFFRFDGGRR